MLRNTYLLLIVMVVIIAITMLIVSGIFIYKNEKEKTNNANQQVGFLQESIEALQTEVDNLNDEEEKKEETKENISELSTPTQQYSSVKDKEITEPKIVSCVKFDDTIVFKTSN